MNTVNDAFQRFPLSWLMNAQTIIRNISAFIDRSRFLNNKPRLSHRKCRVMGQMKILGNAILLQTHIRTHRRHTNTIGNSHFLKCHRLKYFHTIYPQRFPVVLPNAILIGRWHYELHQSDHPNPSSSDNHDNTPVQTASHANSPTQIQNQ
jgi:hypothetical protein